MLTIFWIHLFIFQKLIFENIPMLVRQPAVTKETYQPLVLLSSLVLWLSLISCECRNPEQTTGRYGGLIQ